MRLSGICIITQDVARLSAFYQNVLGATADGDETHTSIRGQGYSLDMFSALGMEEMAPGSMEGAGTGSYTMNFEVHDVDTEYRRLQAMSVPIIKPPMTYPWGTRSVWFRDPDGNIINFFSRVAD